LFKAKKFGGKQSVIEAAAASSPPAEGVKVSVAATPLLNSILSSLAMTNEFTKTRSPMCPLDNAVKFHEFRSSEVVTLTPLATAAVAFPIVSPVTVTATAVDAANVPLLTENTIEL
jgi:hypothetical protein